MENITKILGRRPPRDWRPLLGEVLDSAPEEEITLGRQEDMSAEGPKLSSSDMIISTKFEEDQIDIKIESDNFNNRYRIPEVIETKSSGVSVHLFFF